MELKKNPNLELSKYSILFFNIGLALAIGFVLIVFEWETVETTSTVNLSNNVEIFEDIIDVPLTNQATPPPLKIQQPKIIEVPDEEEIVENVEFDLDIDITEEIIVEELAIENGPEEEIADEVFSIVEKMPAFPGGTAEWHNYISSNLKYPRRAQKAKVEGKVIMRFVVGVDGDVSQVEVLKGIGFDCDEEAIRVLQSSPNWIPGQQRGRNVKVRVMMPLTFDLSS